MSVTSPATACSISSVVGDRGSIRGSKQALKAAIYCSFRSGSVRRPSSVFPITWGPTLQFCPVIWRKVWSDPRLLLQSIRRSVNVLL